MSWKGPRERKEPSPPFKDPNPDKAKAVSALKSGKKIVKLTKIGESLRKKVKEKTVFNDEEKKAVSSYMGGPGLNINELLREGKILDPIYEKIKFGLDKITSRKLKSDATLYRLIRFSGSEKSNFYKTLTPTFTDKAFVSTSNNFEKFRRSFMKNYFYGNGILMKIYVKKGQKGCDISSISSFKNEAEVLLPRNTKFKIVDYDKIKKDIIECRVVD
ncbi:ADP-ribosyltransferase [Candidatus Pacearchaeota archaeon]|jgi:hypothetical protein|nr:ADP-ribosyltransferase [Candidatus Pacearchaeota archaeon]